MKRRVIVIGGVILGVVLVASWWLLAEKLTAQEQVLVGRWRLQPIDGDTLGILELRSDRQCSFTRFTRPEKYWWGTSVLAHWWLKDGVIYLDHEESPIRRNLRSACYFFGIPIASQTAFVVVSATGDKIVTATASGPGDVWTRAQED